MTTGTPRYKLPDSGLAFSGWKDYDRAVLTTVLSLRDEVFYLSKRLDLIFFNSFEHVYLRSAPNHRAVNGPEMSFFMVGTTAICSVIEALGSFILGAGNDGNPGINKKRFKVFLDAYMKPWVGGTPLGTDVPQWLWTNLRNGLAHGLTIQDGGLEDLVQDRFRETSRGKLEVHAELLYQDLKIGKDAYLADVAVGTNSALGDPFRARFSEIYRRF